MTPCTPCVDSKRPRVYVQNVPVCTGTTRTCFNTYTLKHMCAWCRHTRGRFECTHGGVLEAKYEFFHFFQRAATHTHTHTLKTHHDHQQHHDHNDTHHTTQHTTSHGDRERERQRKRERETETETVTETERQRDRETERQRDRETERQRDRETERQRETQRQRQRHVATSHCRAWPKSANLFIGDVPWMFVQASSFLLRLPAAPPHTESQTRTSFSFQPLQFSRLETQHR